MEHVTLLTSMVSRNVWIIFIIDFEQK